MSKALLVFKSIWGTRVLKNDYLQLALQGTTRAPSMGPSASISPVCSPCAETSWLLVGNTVNL